MIHVATERPEWSDAGSAKLWWSPSGGRRESGRDARWIGKISTATRATRTNATQAEQSRTVWREMSRDVLARRMRTVPKVDSAGPNPPFHSFTRYNSRTASALGPGLLPTCGQALEFRRPGEAWDGVAA